VSVLLHLSRAFIREKPLVTHVRRIATSHQPSSIQPQTLTVDIRVMF
jgi:hypothetical protein